MFWNTRRSDLARRETCVRGEESWYKNVKKLQKPQVVYISIQERAAHDLVILG